MNNNETKQPFSYIGDNNLNVSNSDKIIEGFANITSEESILESSRIAVDDPLSLISSTNRKHNDLSLQGEAPVYDAEISQLMRDVRETYPDVTEEQRKQILADLAPRTEHASEKTGQSKKK